jgi:hypothetical protein
MQKVQARDLKMYLGENYIFEIACRPFSSYIVNFQPRSNELDAWSELSLPETTLAQEAVVNHEMG